MPLRQFPSPFRVGTDICQIPRLTRLLRPTHEETARKYGVMHRFYRFLNRLMTDYEEAGFWCRHEINTSTLIKDTVHHDATIRHLAGRWAAKEAVVKASPRPVSFHQILVAAGVDNKPYGVILDTALERKYTSVEICTGITGKHLQFSGGKLSRHTLDLPPLLDIDGQIIPLSISHDGDYATAIALCPVNDTRENKSPRDVFDDLTTSIVDRGGSGRSAVQGR